MKRILSLIAFVFAFVASQQVKASNVTFYAKATVEVAEECTGQGTVYFDDNSTEQTGTGNAVGSDVEGQYVSFQLVITPAEGYEVDKIVDQNGKEYELGNAYVSVYSTSQVESEPSVFNLKVYFKEASGAGEEGGNTYVFSKTITSTDKYGTMTLPVDCELPGSIVAYTVDGINGKTLQLSVVEGAVPANTPVILENTSFMDSNIEVKFDKSLIADECTAVYGLLCGVYPSGTIPASDENYTTYVLQNHDGVVAFYRVEEAIAATNCGAYLELSGVSNVNELYISDVVTAIKSITTGKSEIYDVSGNRLQKLQKGINIVNGVKILVK